MDNVDIKLKPVEHVDVYYECPICHHVGSSSVEMMQHVNAHSKESAVMNALLHEWNVSDFNPNNIYEGEYLTINDLDDCLLKVEQDDGTEKIEGVYLYKAKDLCIKYLEWLKATTKKTQKLLDMVNQEIKAKESK